MEDLHNRPTSTSMIDAFGVTRTFKIRYPESLVGGFLIEAIEEKDDGYEFSAFSSSSYRHAFGELLAKIRARTSTRYLVEANDGLTLTHDRIKGHITSSGVVVDGKLVTFDMLAGLLKQTEGSHIDIAIRELDSE